MHKLKSAFSAMTSPTKSASDSHISSQPQHQAPSHQPPRLRWPPALLSPPLTLGPILDTSPRHYPRDFGRSIQLSGHTYYLFGDTFCFSSPPSQNFLGVTNNTIALVPDLHTPAKSTWLQEYGEEERVEEFVSYTEEEEEMCRRWKEEGKNKRIVNWAFGGIAPVPNTQTSGCAEAWMFYDSGETLEASVIHGRGIGVAKLSLSSPSNPNTIVCERTGPFPLFDPTGPSWGNMSILSAPDGYTYLLTGRDLDNYIARLLTSSSFADPSNYTFLHKDGHWHPHYSPPYGPLGSLAHDILAGQGQGALLYLPDFAPEGKPYVWVGCSKFLTGRVWVGVAERPEGKWEVVDVGELPRGEGGNRYCVYPHVWGSRLERGEVMVSWSDDGTMGGKVLVGVLRFETEGGEGCADE
ncbi:hypothetical protein BCR34DRAFT_660404 [Clohesyomyces aquaticus]|uniref:Uncharacterized protein n=1 Tax=Clohesyomyces aquaticus TaxID=1231657 RepID=A0A1Y2A6J3_9PLEO|nr:hypothetical protein BCR34DRAFT_660404 [Clohesyomyces aquaticus]